MPEIKDIFNIAGIVLTVLFVIVVLLKTRKGAKRGAYQQPIHLGVVLVGAIISFIATLILSSSIFTALDGYTMEELVLTLEGLTGSPIDAGMRDVILSFEPSTIMSLLALPVALLCPIIFTICYFAVSIVTNIIYQIICKAAAVQKRRDTKGKVIGAALGALEGVIVMTLFLVPFSSILNLTQTVTAEIETDDREIAEVFDSIDSFAETPVLQLASFAGGDFLTKELTTVHVQDSDVNLSNEIAVCFDIFNNVSLLSDIGEGGVSDDQRAAVDAIIAALRRSDYLPMLLSEGTHAISALVFGDLPDTPTKPEEKLTKALADMLATSTADTIIDDIVMIKDAAFLLIDNGVFEALEGGDESAITDLLSKRDAEGNSVIKQAIRLLTTNPRTTGIITALNEMSVALMCQSMGIEGDAAQVYEDLKQGLNDVAAITPDSYETEEEYHEALGETLNQTLVNNGIELEEEVLDNMTGYVGDYLEEARENGTLDEQLTDENVTEIILTYYDAYLQYQENGTVPEIPGLPGLPGGEGGNGDNSEGGGPLPSLPGGTGDNSGNGGNAQN
ncbi:MAG: CvpA family protein [Clostridia bacterium]|nr:CvpA family protein [Clostridia bacterium]